MTDLSMTIAPKSDQLNADDLILGPRTITITKVSANPSSAEQPVSIYFEGDNDKPYRPCKSMRRVLVQVWGKDGSAYTGRSMTIYRDPKVQFGGLEVGGIRISHMSHIERETTMALTATRANRKPFTVRPLQVAQKPKMSIDEWLAQLQQSLADCQDLEAVEKIATGKMVTAALAKASDEIKTKINGIVKVALDKFSESTTTPSDEAA